MIKYIDFELSSICNAGCPVCPRREGGNFTSFHQTYWTFEEVKRVLDVEIVRNLEGFNVCGNFGDGMGNPDIVKICEWVRSINKDCSIIINTNGGLGATSNYAKLGELGVYMVFGIDGYKDKNELYRVNAKWDKVYSNLITYAHSLKQYHPVLFGEIQFLTWDQTRDQILPIAKLCATLGNISLYLRKPYKMGEYTYAYNMKGEFSHGLTLTEDSAIEKYFDRRFNIYGELNDLILELEETPLQEYPLITVLDENIVYSKNKNPYTVREPIFSDQDRTLLDSKTKQTCYSINSFYPDNLEEVAHNLYITHDKLLMPCCLIPPQFALYIEHSNNNESPYQIELLNKVLSIGLEKFSLKNKTILEVFYSGVLHDFVYNNIMNKNPLSFCKSICGKCV